MTRNWRLGGGILLSAVLLLAFALGRPRNAPASYSAFTRELRQGNVASVTISGRHAAVALHQGAPLEIVLPADMRDVIEELNSANAGIRFEDTPSWERILLNSTPFLVLLCLWLVLLFRFRGRPHGGLPFI